MIDELTTVVSFRQVNLDEANRLLVLWGHKMGPVVRGNQTGWCHALFHGSEPVGVTTAHTLIRERVGGGNTHLTRSNTVELSRVCAARPDICRVLVRMWREFVFPSLGFQAAMSYQDAVQHRGDLYRFDGWGRSGEKARSGVDSRSGRRGRVKVVWVFPKEMAL